MTTHPSFYTNFILVWWWNKRLCLCKSRLNHGTNQY